MLTRVAVADEFLGPRVEILLSDFDAPAKRWRSRLFRILTPPPGPLVTSIL